MQDGSRPNSWWRGAPSRWSRADFLFAAALAASVRLRWSDRARWPLSWDASSFALALERYDVSALRPQAPGYPVYVLLGKLVHLVVPDANAALIVVSLAFTSLALVLAYGLGRAVAGRAVGAGLAVLLWAAPVVYVHSVTANVYAADLACTLAVAWAAWSARLDPSPRRVALLAGVLALAAGVRPSDILFLGPLAAWAALHPPWSLRDQVRRLLPGVATGALICLAWFIPMARASGGVAAWRLANKLQSDQVVFGHTVWRDGWPMLQENLGRIALFLHWELRIVLPVTAALVLAGVLAKRRLDQSARGRRRWWFLVIWMAPALLFYSFVFSGYDKEPSGYILVVLPALLLGALAMASWAIGRMATTRQGRAILAAALLAGPVVALTAHRHDVIDVQYHAHDDWSDAWAALPESYPPANTSIVALWSFAHVWWAFPDYTAYNFRPPAQGPGEVPDFLLIQVAKDHEATPDWYAAVAARETGSPHALPPGTKHLVLFDFQLAGENGGPRRLALDLEAREDHLPNGWRILVVDTTPDRPNLEDYVQVDPAAGS